MMELLTAFFAGLALGGGVMAWRKQRVQRALDASVPATQAHAQALALQNAAESLQAQLDAMHQDLEHAREQWRSERSALEQQHQDAVQQVMYQANTMQRDANEHSTRLAQSLAELLGVSKTFERWHADMNILLTHNQGMHSKNDDLSLIHI